MSRCKQFAYRKNAPRTHRCQHAFICYEAGNAVCVYDSEKRKRCVDSDQQVMAARVQFRQAITSRVKTRSAIDVEAETLNLKTLFGTGPHMI